VVVITIESVGCQLSTHWLGQFSTVMRRANVMQRLTVTSLIVHQRRRVAAVQ